MINGMSDWKAQAVRDLVAVHDWAEARRLTRVAVEEGIASVREGDIGRPTARVEIDGVEVGQVTNLIVGFRTRVTNGRRTGPLEVLPS